METVMEIVLRILMNVMTAVFAWLFSIFTRWAVQGWFDHNATDSAMGITGMLIMGIMILICSLDMRDMDNEKRNS